MVLTKADKAYLLSINESEQYFPQIEEAMEVTKYELTDADGRETIRSISRKEAIDLLGRETWLNGLDRSAFHWTAMRETKDGKGYVLLDSSALFREEEKKAETKPAEPKKERTGKFKLTFNLSGSFISPIDYAVNEIRAFCDFKGVECNVYKSGRLMKKYDFVIKGELKESEIYKFKNAVTEYLGRIGGDLSL